jgi:hypothetical protein
MGEQHANGWRVSRHRLVADATVGVIANPRSGRDIRRLVASASVFPNAEKASMVVRLTAAAGAFGVGRVLVSTDTFGVSAAVLRESRRRAEAGDPRSKLRTSRHARATSSAGRSSQASPAPGTSGPPPRPPPGAGA